MSEDFMDLTTEERRNLLRIFGRGRQDAQDQLDPRPVVVDAIAKLQGWLAEHPEEAVAVTQPAPRMEREGFDRQEPETTSKARKPRVTTTKDLE